MNPFEKHAYLQYIPDELLKNPEPNSFQEFLRKRMSTCNRLRIAMIIAFTVYLILLLIFEAVHTTVKELAVFDNIFNLIPLVIFFVLAVLFNNLMKKYSIAENEIGSLIEQLKSKR